MNFSKRPLHSGCRPVARIFRGGSVPQERGLNNECWNDQYAVQVPKTHREECPTYGLTEIGTIFDGTGNFCERRRKREPVESLGAFPPPPPPMIKFSNLKALKCHFQHSPAKIDRYFLLNFYKRALSSALLYFHNK